MIGKTLANFRITAKLGEGGMGEVYRAEDTRLGREVAIKVLPEALTTDPERMARFQREARVLASLNHPNIAAIHQVEDAEGLELLVMELIEGVDLAERLAGGSQSVEQTIAIALQIARALEAAHAKGIVHRDLKPANVLLGDDGRVRVLDFGLARREQPEAEGSHEDTLTALTRQGAIVGTVPYMSPEQVSGKTVDHRTDLFSLGVIVYQMATGRHPFAGESATHTMSAILRDTPAPIGELRAELPEALGRIVAHLLEKNPARRFQSAGEVRAEFEALRREVESGAVQSAAAAVQRPRRRAWLAVVGVAAIASILGFFLLRSQTGGPPDPEAGSATAADSRRMIAVLPFENLGPPEDEYFAAGMTEEITSRLAAVSGLGVISRNSAAQYAGTGKPTSQIGEELGVDYLLGGTIRWARDAEGASRLRITPRLVDVADDTWLWSASFDRSYENIFAIQSEIAEEVLAQLDVTVLGDERHAVGAFPTRNPEAYQEYLKSFGLFRLDCEYLLGAIAGLERAVALDPEFAKAWAQLAELRSMYYLRCQTTEENREAARRAVDRAVEVGPGSPEAILGASRFEYQVERDYEAALTWIRSAGDAVNRHPRLSQQRGTILRRLGRWEDAIQSYERALELDPRSHTIAHDLAVSQVWLRHYAEALRYYDLAFSLGSARPTDFQQRAEVYWIWRGDTQASRAALEAVPDEVVDDGAIAWAWYWQEIYDGNPREALDRLASVQDGWIEIVIHRWPVSLAAGLAHELLGEVDRARSLYEEAHRILRAEVAATPDDTQPRRALSLASAALGRKEEALAEAARAVEKWPLDEHPFWGVTPLENKALVHTMVGEHDLALDLIEQLLEMPSQLSFPLLELDPRWAPLRGEPRYAELREKYGGTR